MTSIDEVIAHAREVAKRNRKQWKNCPADRRDIEHQTCEQCTEEHEQIAEWLVELKVYQKQHIAICEKYDVNTIEDLYDKAIDDAKDIILQTLDNEVLIDTLHLRLEQLKAGKYND